MGKKRDKANENILILIDSLVSTRESALGSGNCCYWAEKTRPCTKYDNDCVLCKTMYFSKMRENLEKEYVVR